MDLAPPLGNQPGRLALKRSKFRMPVYACGYNWLASNSVAADRLRSRIDAVISANNRNGFKCDQVILITQGDAAV